jgi:hypothetical protein
MENAVIRPHKSHMANEGRPPVRSLSGGGGRIPAAAGMPAAADGAYDILTAVRHGIPAACMVIASARREAGAWCVRRVTAGTAAGPALAVNCQALAAAQPAADTTDVARGRTAGTAIRRMPSAREGGVPLSARGHRHGAPGGTGSARCRVIGKGQEAYFAADGTGSHRISGTLWLSLHESLLSPQDLPSATLSNESCMQSNIFKFVMT